MRCRHHSGGCMCTLFLAVNQLRGYPVVLAGNRDEMMDRPWTGPRRQRDPAVFAPNDAVQGGTWMGVRIGAGGGEGLIAAVTNRRLGYTQAGHPSRGWLTLGALSATDVEAARQWLKEQLDKGPYNPFNFVVAGPEGAWWLRYDGAHLVDEGLGSGVHVITSHHELNPPVLAPLAEAVCLTATRAPDLTSFVSGVRPVLSDHDLRDHAYSVCKHGDVYGTRSAAVLALDDQGRPSFSFASGPPCEHELLMVLKEGQPL